MQEVQDRLLPHGPDREKIQNCNGRMLQDRNIDLYCTGKLHNVYKSVSANTNTLDWTGLAWPGLEHPYFRRFIVLKHITVDLKPRPQTYGHLCLLAVKESIESETLKQTLAPSQRFQQISRRLLINSVGYRSKCSC